MPKATVKRPDVISDRTWPGQQSWNREVIQVINDHKVRLRIKVDSYDFQSYGLAEVWTGEQWNEVHRIPGQELRSYGKVSYVSKDCPPSAFDPDLNELREVVLKVLT